MDQFLKFINKKNDEKDFLNINFPAAKNIKAESIFDDIKCMNA